MNNKKTIYIHAGTGKTGTTSIQNFLYENRTVLKEKDILYPVGDGLKLNRSGNYHSNLRAFIDKVHDFDFSNKNIKEIKNFFDKNSQYFHLEEIKKSEQSKMILSDEMFTNTSLDFNYLKMLVRLLKEFDFNVKIIIYLRQPADYLCSMWQELMKWKFNLEDVLDCVGSEFFNSIFSMPSLVEEIGVENVIIKPFDKAQFKDKNLIVDFLDIFDVELDDSFKPLEKDANIGFGRNQCHLLRIINLMKLSNNAIYLKAKKMPQPKEPKIVETLSDEEILRITNYYEEAYTKLANLYDKDSFFDTLLPSCYGKERPTYDSVTFSKEQMDLIFESLKQAYLEKRVLECRKDTFIERIFSARNERNLDGSISKVITILGFKMKFNKRKKSRINDYEMP